MGKRETKKLKLFAGPCVLESRDLAFDVAGSLMEGLSPFQERLELIFKGSFDKANRTSLGSYRGPGMEKGLSYLDDLGQHFHLPTVTDFHLPEQASPVASVVDYLQVPAFLCRQTDMILSGAQACAQYGRKLKIKKGQFLSPQEVGPIIEKAQSHLPLSSIILTERGTSFGYNHLVVDMASFPIMKSFGVTVIHDVTHCLQRPGSLGHGTGGAREYAEILARGALMAQADGLFMEVHPDPPQALSDASTCLKLAEVPALVGRLLQVFELAQELGTQES